MGVRPSSLPLLLYPDDPKRWLRMMLKQHFLTDGRYFYIKSNNSWKVISHYHWH
jgi:hypothetical protein